MKLSCPECGQKRALAGGESTFVPKPHGRDVNAGEIRMAVVCENPQCSLAGLRSNELVEPGDDG